MPPQPLTLADVTALRMAQEAHRNPFAYRLKVALLGGLAYFYIGLIVTLALGMLVGLFLLFKFLFSSGQFVRLGISTLKILIPVTIGLCVFVAVVLKSLWVTFPELDGLEIAREEAVPLFLEVDRLRSALKTPRIHRILLTDEFNAAVVQRPRLGLFGWPENSLMIGIPLMAMLSPEQFRAVLAHELGHVSGAHGRFGSWVYRTSMTWFQMLAALHEEESWGVIPLALFFQWFAPCFWAHSFAIRKAHEFEADRSAADAVGALAVASALMASEMAARILTTGERPVDARDAQRWINDAVSVPEDPYEDHPSLAARLRALGVPAQAPEPATEIALQKYLGHRAPALAQRFGREVILSAGKGTDSPPSVAPVATMRTIGG